MSLSSFFYVSCPPLSCFFFFFFNDTATTEIYTLSLHDALPISPTPGVRQLSTTPSNLLMRVRRLLAVVQCQASTAKDRKSTRLNSSHGYISYAVFCLKKKKTRTLSTYQTNSR